MSKQYTVAAGDTLWCIAKEQLGSYEKYTELVRLNKLKVATLNEGQKLILSR